MVIYVTENFSETELGIKIKALSTDRGGVHVFMYQISLKVWSLVKTNSCIFISTKWSLRVT